MQSATFKHRAAETRALLAETFPACFAGQGAKKHPLKVGIFCDIKRALPELSAKALSVALKDYTDGPTYLRNVVGGASRVGLDGTPCGEVTEAQAAHAAKRMKRFGERAPKVEREAA